MRAVRYEKRYEADWNRLLANSKNGTFLFDRGYMEYHGDRFEDYSLLFFDEREHLVGLLPASRHGDSVVSHGGLTYGGIVSTVEMKTVTMLRVFEATLEKLRSDGFESFRYKPIPHIFHQIPAEEDLYALFANDAKIYRRDASSAIYLPERMKFAKGKREGVRKARKAGLEVAVSDDFDTFFAMGKQVMHERHNVQPVHSSDEMRLLADRFPGKIQLHASYQAGHMLAGVLTYVFPTSVHAQYMYNSNEGMDKGALDIVLDYLINILYADLRYFSFGISTENGGRFLNEGLIHQKEMFGARSIVHDFYEIRLA